MTRDQCPNCKARLPRRAEFLPPTYGRESIFGVTAFVAGYAAAFFVLFHLSWPADLWPWRMGQMGARLVTGAVFYGAWVAIIGVGSTTVYWLAERNQRPGPRPVRYDSEVQIGGDIRAVTSHAGQRRWLREAGYTIPAEPERGALVHWLFAVHDKKVTFSQRGARTAVRDNAAVRAWSSDILALWCLAGWAAPASGWNGDVPDLSQGVSDVDDAVIYEVARGGYEALIDMLITVVEASVEPPHSDDESASPTGGFSPAPPTTQG